MHIYKLF